MIRILKNRRALSTVVTTLIILVVSILLASVLTSFAINVVSTRVQEESLHVSKQNIWVDSNNAVQGAIMVANTGGRDVVISKIAVRGQPSDWTNVYSLTVTKADAGLTADLPHLTTVAAGAVAGFAAPLVSTSGSLVLPSGETLVIYIDSPDSIGINDIGLTVGIAVHSAQAVYYSETNILAYS
jgi:hypothetical protein